MALSMKNVIEPSIREARSRAAPSVSRQELAARLQALGVDIDQTAISRIENGERLVTDIEVIVICRALGLDVGTLFRGLEHQTWKRATGRPDEEKRRERGPGARLRVSPGDSVPKSCPR